MANDDRPVLRESLRVVGLFVLAGLGVGLTGGVTITQLGGGSGIGAAFVAGFLLLMVVTVALLLGPVVAIFAGMQFGARAGTGASQAGASFASSVAGYGIMMIVVLVLIVAASVVALGGTDTTSSTTTGTFATPTPTSGGGGMDVPVDVGRFLVPIGLVAIPTGLAGAGATVLVGLG